eukprot:1388620-Prymnesium_polylepis.1
MSRGAPSAVPACRGFVPRNRPNQTERGRETRQVPPPGPLAPRKAAPLRRADNSTKQQATRPTRNKPIGRMTAYGLKGSCGGGGAARTPTGAGPADNAAAGRNHRVLKGKLWDAEPPGRERAPPVNQRATFVAMCKNASFQDRC